MYFKETRSFLRTDFPVSQKLDVSASTALSSVSEAHAEGREPVNLFADLTCPVQENVQAAVLAVVAATAFVL